MRSGTLTRVLIIATLLLSACKGEEPPPAAGPQVEPSAPAANAPNAAAPSQAAPEAAPPERSAPADSAGALDGHSASPAARTPAVEDPEARDTSSLAPRANADERPVARPAPSAAETERVDDAERGTTGSSVRLLADNNCPVQINRATLARRVERREPVGAGDSFAARGEPVYLFLEVDNATGPEREMTIRWDHLESDHLFVQTIPAGASASWRTWVYHTIWPDFRGEWRVQVLAPNNCPVAELDFTAT